MLESYIAVKHDIIVAISKLEQSSSLKAWVDISQNSNLPVLSEHNDTSPNALTCDIIVTN